MGYIIFSIILIIIVLLLLIRIRFILYFDEGNNKAFIKILFFKIYLFGKPEKPIRKKDFKIKKFRKRVKKVLEKQDNKDNKKEKIKEDKKEEKVEKADKEPNSIENNEKESVNKKLQDVLDKIKLAKDSFDKILKKFPKYLVIKLFKIVISVGGEDASEMAINYGYVIQSVEYLLAFIKDKLNVDINKKTIINVYPDFPNGKWNIDIRAEIYIRVINILKLGYFALVGYLKFKNNNKKRG